MESEYDNEIKKSFEEEIQRGLVLVKDNVDRYFSELELYYPIGFSGIKWAAVNNVYCVNIDTMNGKENLRKVNNFLENISCKSPDLLNETVAIFGDNATQMSYEMNFRIFLEKWDVFFSVPQHTYVFFCNIKKCINFTFENELFFG